MLAFPVLSNKEAFCTGVSYSGSRFRRERHSCHKFLLSGFLQQHTLHFKDIMNENNFLLFAFCAFICLSLYPLRKKWNNAAIFTCYPIYYFIDLARPLLQSVSQIKNPNLFNLVIYKSNAKSFTCAIPAPFWLCGDIFLIL